MKKIIYFLFFILLSFSCSNDDKPKNEFLNQILGDYRLKAAYTDVPIDLNFDGIPQTNVIEEGECFYDDPRFYRSQIRFNKAYDYKSLWLTIMYRDMESDEQCLFGASMFYDYEVNEGTKEIIITYNDEERETLFGTLKKVKWIDDIAYYEYEKEFYTSEGWKTVTLYMEYYKDYEDHTSGS